MDIGKRIKQIRKENNLTQEAFGASFGVSKSMVALVEAGRADFSKSALKFICNIYRVNEEWLKDGIGEPYIPKKSNEIIAEFSNDIMEASEDSFKSRFVRALATMNEKEWELLENFVDKIKNAEN